MCGIAFLFDEQVPEVDARARMSSALCHMNARGPDDRNQVYSSCASLGHVRLSIIDLNASRQPMCSPDNRYILSFNGEIYNYRFLRDGLKDRWDFRTDGDTEVLLAGLILEGDRFLLRMEGMWAFLLWDSNTKTVFLARDRTGKKPLYFVHEGEGFACASELPALHTVWGKTWAEDLDSTSDFFRYGYPLPGKTFYQNVSELRPATWCRWTPSGGLTGDTYWRPEVRPFIGRYTDAQDTLKALLDESMEQRLVSDVEVGSFLSGGLDSSIVSMLAARQLGSKQVKTFSMGFSEVAYDERAFARRVAQHIGSQHHEHELQKLEPSLFKELLHKRLGQPFCDPSLLPTAELARTAAEKVKVALAGDGADELFCGYQRYKARAIMKSYLKVPKPIRNVFRACTAKLPEPAGHHSRSFLKKLHLFMSLVDKEADTKEYIAPMYFSDQDLSAYAPDLKEKGHSFFNPLALPEDISDIKHMMLSDTFVYMPQDIHTKVDRASMAHSLEVREPFMSTELVEFALSLPVEWVLSWRKNKKILAETFKSDLPGGLTKRRKQGFSVPLASWFRGDLGELLNAQLETLSHDSILNKTGIKNMLEEHRTHERDFGFQLWLIYVYLVWRKETNLLKEPT